MAKKDKRREAEAVAEERRPEPVEQAAQAKPNDDIVRLMLASRRRAAELRS